MYTPKITTDITVVGKVTARDLFHARGSTYLGDRADDEIVMRGTVTTSLHFGHDKIEPYGPPLPFTRTDGTVVTTQAVRGEFHPRPSPFRLPNKSKQTLLHRIVTHGRPLRKTRLARHEDQ